MELTELNKYNLKNNINAHFACETSEDGKISIVTDIDVIVMQYKPNIENETNNFTFDKYFITLSDYHIANETGIAINEIVTSLPRENFYRLVRNDIFTPELENASPQITKPIAAIWSPAAVFRKSDSILAAISNTGNVEIFYGLSLDYKRIVNLTELWVNELKIKWNEFSIDSLNLIKKSELHEQRVKECFASCVTWSFIYEFHDGKFCYIATGYINGTISIWRFTCTEEFNQNTEIDPPLLIGYFDSGIEKLSAINWCYASQNTAWIIFGSKQGVVGSIFIVFNESQQFDIKHKNVIWPENDIKVSKIISMTEQNHSCFLIIKNSFMLIILMDNSDYSIKCKKTVNFGNLFISGIQSIGSNSFVVCSFTGIIKKIKINISNNCAYEIENVKTDINWDTYATYGIFRLKDGYIWGILKYPCKMFDHLAQRNPIDISFCIINNLDPGKILKENTTKHLHHYWELMDIIRCLASKTETLPCLWLTGIDKYDEISFYELRIIYWLTKASHRFLLLHPKAKKLNCKFPEPEIMEEIFFYRYHFERLKYTLNLYESEEMLPIYLLYSIYMLQHSIMILAEKEYIKEYFSDNFHNEVKKIIEKVNNLDNVLTPICIICELKFKNGQCPNMHMDDKCIITHVQTKGISKWNCSMCQKMAHEDLDEDNPYCPLCDIPLLQYDPASDQYRTDI